MSRKRECPALGTHLLRPDAAEQLVLSQQEISLEAPLPRVRRRDGEFAAAEINLVVLAEVEVRRPRLGVDGARDAVQGRVATDGAEKLPHLGARLEARGAAQDPLLHPTHGHAVEGQKRQAHLRVAPFWQRLRRRVRFRSECVGRAC